MRKLGGDATRTGPALEPQPCGSVMRRRPNGKAAGSDWALPTAF